MSFGAPKCPECGKSVDLQEYVQMSAELIRGEQVTSLGIETYCVTCWYELQEESDDKAQKDRQ